MYDTRCPHCTGPTCCSHTRHALLYTPQQTMLQVACGGPAHPLVHASRVHTPHTPQGGSKFDRGWHPGTRHSTRFLVCLFQVVAAPIPTPRCGGASAIQAAPTPATTPCVPQHTLSLLCAAVRPVPTTTTTATATLLSQRRARARSFHAQRHPLSGATPPTPHSFMWGR